MKIVRHDLLQRLAAAHERLKTESSRCALKYQTREKLSLAKPGRPGLVSLQYPMPGYRVTQALQHGQRFFETPRRSVEEDLVRVGSLLTAKQGRRGRRRARKLAHRLLTAIENGCLCPSLASSIYLRELRIRVTGGMWQLHDQLQHLPRAVFTIIGRDLSLTEDELRRLDVKRVIEALRGALRRAGAGRAGGCLILFLHGEWDDNTQRHQLHFHGWAAGEMIDVVRKLRGQRRYKSTEQDRAGDTDGVRNRVVVSCKPLSNPAYRLSYRLQPFWPARRTGDLAELNTGKCGRYRQRAKHRLPEPQHARHLLWLDRWSVNDICLRIGVDVYRGKLRACPARTSSMNGGV